VREPDVPYLSDAQDKGSRQAWIKDEVKTEAATIDRTCYHTCVHLAVLRICDTRALDAPDRGALTVRCTYYLWDSNVLCLYDTRSVWYDTRCVMLYVRVGPQEMTSCDVMTGRLLYDEEA
jgi:hypothetical protein